MKKTLQVTKITLADSQSNARDGQVFAICELQEKAKNSDKLSKLRTHSVIVAGTYSWLIDISDYEGKNNEAKLESARADLIGESDEFTCITISVEELTSGAHKGFKVKDNEDYGTITSRNLVGYETEDELKSRELGRLNRQAGETIEWVDEEEA